MNTKRSQIKYIKTTQDDIIINFVHFLGLEHLEEMSLPKKTDREELKQIRDMVKGYTNVLILSDDQDHDSLQNQN